MKTCKGNTIARRRFVRISRLMWSNGGCSTNSNINYTFKRNCKNFQKPRKYRNIVRNERLRPATVRRSRASVSFVFRALSLGTGCKIGAKLVTLGREIAQPLARIVGGFIKRGDALITNPGKKTHALVCPVMEYILRFRERGCVVGSR